MYDKKVSCIVFCRTHWLDPELPGIVVAGIPHGRKAMLQGSRGMETTLRNLRGDSKFILSRHAECWLFELSVKRVQNLAKCTLSNVFIVFLVKQHAAFKYMKRRNFRFSCFLK